MKAVAGLAGFPTRDENASGLSRTDTEEFAELYRTHQGLVRSVIFQISGSDGLDDLVQEAFIRIWKGMPGFRREAQLSSWIFRVSTNIALDHCRSRTRRPEGHLASAIESDIVPLPSPETGFTHRDLVMKGLMNLSEEHRVTLVLAFLHDLPLAEVAEVLDISEGTVKSRLHYAKAQFREFLASKGVKL